MYIRIEHKKNEVVDTFIANNDLFATFKAPCHVVFIENFINNIKKFKDVFSRYNMGENIFFSCKSNKSNSLLFYATKNGCGIEVSSIYELHDALRFTNKIIATGPAKSKEYIELAISKHIIISVDDIEELKVIYNEHKPVNIFLRISDPIKITSRFGINKKDVRKCINLIKNSKIKIVGLAFHINNYSLNDRILAIKECLKLIKKYQLNVEYIDIGGGIPIEYCSKADWDNFNKNRENCDFFKNKEILEYYPYYNEISAEIFLEEIFKKTKNELGEIKIISELGRSLLDNCGISIFEVQYVKTLPNNEKIIITNGNINNLSEQWFNSDYLVNPDLIIKSKRKNKDIFASVAGNLCLEQDIITWRKIKFPVYPQKGDYLIYYNTAGYQMDSNESTFHKIPILPKYIVIDNENDTFIEKDEKYDRK